ncbi:MAG: ABC transporter permease [Chloroflexi bacterium 44-23]|nr:MAG: ABC transporter permease [Chloroflexi bacterium 44-23]
MAQSIANIKRAQSRWKNFRNILANAGLPALSFIVLLGGWEILVRLLNVPEYILPLPSVFFARVFKDWNLLQIHFLVTAREVLLGFGIAAITSIPLALVIALIPPIEKAFYPIVVFFQLIPKIAIAPLLIVWFGFGMFPKVFLTFLLCFFPILVNSISGFKAIDPRILYITRSMGANRLQTFAFVRMPTALPFIFAGLAVSIVMAVTGAIVGEFVGANAGLGYLLLRGSSYLDTSLMFAVLVVLSLMGLVFSYAVTFLEKAVMPWRRYRKEE